MIVIIHINLYDSDYTLIYMIVTTCHVVTVQVSITTNEFNTMIMLHGHL